MEFINQVLKCLRMWFTNPIALIKIFDSSFPELALSLFLFFLFCKVDVIIKDASSIGATKRTIRSENIIKINIFSNIGQGCVQREREREEGGGD